VEALREMTTEVVRVFHKFAHVSDNRGTALEGDAFRSRLAILENRILECERRLNIPPAA
jgi:hypothetical protein